MANPENFTADIVSVVIGVIVVAAVAVPIINGMVGTNGKPNASDTYPIQEGTMLATIVQILPVFLVLAVLMMIVYLFISKKRF